MIVLRGALSVGTDFVCVHIVVGLLMHTTYYIPCLSFLYTAGSVVTSQHWRLGLLRCCSECILDANLSFLCLN